MLNKNSPRLLYALTDATSQPNNNTAGDPLEVPLASEQRRPKSAVGYAPMHLERPTGKELTQS